MLDGPVRKFSNGSNDSPYHLSKSMEATKQAGIVVLDFLTPSWSAKFFAKTYKGWRNGDTAGWKVFATGGLLAADTVFFIQMVAAVIGSVGVGAIPEAGAKLGFEAFKRASVLIIEKSTTREGALKLMAALKDVTLKHGLKDLAKLAKKTKGGPEKVAKLLVKEAEKQAAVKTAPKLVAPLLRASYSARELLATTKRLSLMALGKEAMRILPTLEKKYLQRKLEEFAARGLVTKAEKRSILRVGRISKEFNYRFYVSMAKDTAEELCAPNKSTSECVARAVTTILDNALILGGLYGVQWVGGAAFKGTRTLAGKGFRLVGGAPAVLDNFVRTTKFIAVEKVLLRAGYDGTKAADIAEAVAAAPFFKAGQVAKSHGLTGKIYWQVLSVVGGVHTAIYTAIAAPPTLAAERHFK